MSWHLVKNAFFVEKDGMYQHIDIGICDNCNGIHIPPESASACEDRGTETYENLIKRLKRFKDE